MRWYVVKPTITAETRKRVGKIHPWRNEDRAGWKWQTLVADSIEHAIGNLRPDLAKSSSMTYLVTMPPPAESPAKRMVDGSCSVKRYR